MAKKKKYEYHEYRNDFQDPVERKAQKQRLRETFREIEPPKRKITEYDLDSYDTDDLFI